MKIAAFLLLYVSRVLPPSRIIELQVESILFIIWIIQDHLCIRGMDTVEAGPMDVAVLISWSAGFDFCSVLRKGKKGTYQQEKKKGTSHTNGFGL